MSELSDFFAERKQEVDAFILFLERIDQEPNYQNEIKILKSQAILMLYNLIEGTVNKGIETIFDTINDNNLSHDEASQKIRIMWLRYFKLHLDDGQHVERLSSIDDFINKNINIDISKFREINPRYFKGGSLDSRAIINILKKFSIELDSSEYKLKEIKTERNFLAHGEKSFTEVGQEKTVSDVKVTSSKVIDFLDRYVSKIETYINNEAYKINANN
jgi:hypothetical protein